MAHNGPLSDGAGAQTDKWERYRSVFVSQARQAQSAQIATRSGPFVSDERGCTQTDTGPTIRIVMRRGHEVCIWKSEICGATPMVWIAGSGVPLKATSVSCALKPTNSTGVYSQVLAPTLRRR